MKHVIGPPLASPLVDLLSDRSWMPNVQKLRLFGQVLLADTPNQFADEGQPEGVGQNTYPALVAAGFFASVQMPIQIEWGVVKAWSPDGVDAAFDAGLIITRLIRAQGVFDSMSMDEPWTAARRDCTPTVSSDACTQAVLRYTDSLPSWVRYELTEAYPFNRSQDILTWTDQLRAHLGPRLVGLCIDCDWRALKWTKSDRADFSQIRKQCESWGLPLSLISTPNAPTDAASFVETAKQGMKTMLDALGGMPQAIVEESWQPGYPNVVPASDPVTLAALKDYFVSVYGGEPMTTWYDVKVTGKTLALADGRVLSLNPSVPPPWVDGGHYGPYHFSFMPASTDGQYEQVAVNGSNAVYNPTGKESVVFGFQQSVPNAPGMSAITTEPL